MTSSLWPFRITLAFLGIASIRPATVEAQPPVYLTQWGSPGSADAQFIRPSGVATDAAGNVYVADPGNSRIQKFTSTGTYITQWGSFGNGNGVDAAGNVYVADTRNNRIQKFGPRSIVVSFDCTPNSLNLATQGLWITGGVAPPSPAGGAHAGRHRARADGRRTGC